MSRTPFLNLNVQRYTLRVGRSAPETQRIEPRHFASWPLIPPQYPASFSHDTLRLKGSSPHAHVPGAVPDAVDDHLRPERTRIESQPNRARFLRRPLWPNGKNRGARLH